MSGVAIPAGFARRIPIGHRDAHRRRRVQRRFPPPWTFEDHNDARFIVKDATGFAIAYVYYEDEWQPRNLARAWGGAGAGGVMARWRRRR